VRNTLTREEDHKKMRKMHAVYICSECGCPDIEFEVWVHANTDEITGESGDQYWCPCCEDQRVCLAGIETNRCNQDYLPHKDCNTKINWDW
jgi:hypothetical protein